MNSKAGVPNTLHGEKVHSATLMDLYISRTHRVDSDRLHDHINLDPMILIKYVNTTQQLADNLINGSVLAFCMELCGRSASALVAARTVFNTSGRIFCSVPLV